MRISKKNEVYLILKDLDPSTSQELTEFFTFEVPGAKFMPMYRNRMWDGKIRLFSPGTGQIYVGLLPYIKQFCSRNQIEYIIDEGVEDERNVIRQVVRGFIKSLKPKSKGKSLKIRDYQIDAVHHAIARNRALLVSPTASGKSLIIYALVRYCPGTCCQRIYQGHDRKITKDVAISTWQSIYKMPKKYFESFGCVIGDEAHLFKAKSLTGIMTKLHQCKYRFGLTGTLDGTQTHQLVLEGLFGAVENITTTRELMDKKTLANLQIKCIVLRHPNIREKMTYAEELEYLVTNSTRNKFIVDLCRNISGNTLCLFQLVEKHGKILYGQTKDEIDDRKVFFVYGGTDTGTRESIRSIVENEKNSIIIASYGTFSTGINIRNINNIVFASPSKSKIRVLQSIGRGLRISENKNSILVFDIADDVSYKQRRNFTLTHFTERINIYNEQQFNYEISRVNLK